MDFSFSLDSTSPWEDGEGPSEILFSDIEVCPIDEHLTCGILTDITLDII